MKPLETENWQFGEFTLDTRKGILFRGREEVKLRPKSLEALKFLVANSGRLVSKSELMDTLWPGVAVTEDSLAHCVMEVRRALGEAGPVMLRTMPGRGYLFEGGEKVGSSAGVQMAPQGRPRWIWMVALAGLCIAGLGMGYKAWTKQKVEQLVGEANAWTQQKDYAKALEAAQSALALHPDEGRVLRLLNEISDDLTVKTDPPGASIILKRFGDPEEKQIGISPLDQKRVARGDYVMRIEKAGYIPVERTVSSGMARMRNIESSPWDVKVEAKLKREGEAPNGMVEVPEAGKVRLLMSGRTTDKQIRLAAFWIDRFEVTNEAFQKFVDSGRYPAGFRDRTGLPGPMGWSGGRASKELAKHPVTGVSWEEARSYCSYMGKELPTIYQWETAARGQVRTPFGLLYPWGVLNAKEFLQKANLSGSGTTAVGSYPFGMNRTGAYDLAGNVREWLLNRRGKNRAVAGGSWRSEVYEFLGHVGAAASTRADDLGFRCVLGVDAEGAMDLAEEAEVVEYPKALSDAAFEKLRQGYEYESRAVEARTVGRIDGGIWKREEIRYRGANEEEAIAYLYLPKNAKPPYQVIHYLGGSALWLGTPVTEAVEGRMPSMEPYLRAGKAVFVVVLKGFEGRPPLREYALVGTNSSRYTEIVKGWIEDLRRGVDVLVSMPDVKPGKIVFWNHSTTEFGAILAALEKRYAAVVLVGSGLGPETKYAADAVNAALFAPFIEGPKLLMSGSLDEWNPEATVALPFYNSLRGSKKRVVLEGGHIPPANLTVPVALSWLETTLGR
jgi:formylglycine-generating enzyme required for sulfatase activity/DNA-binding winged helix-turn-helix (wHTH) protein